MPAMMPAIFSRDSCRRYAVLTAAFDDVFMLLMPRMPLTDAVCQRYAVMPDSCCR